MSSITLFVKLIFTTCLIFFEAKAIPPLQYSYERDGGIIGKLLKEDYKETPVSNEILPKQYRLNGTWIPENYNLDLTVILDNDGILGDQFTAPGKVSITAKPTEDTNLITLHSNLLQIKEVFVYGNINSDPPTGISVVQVSNDTESGKHFLQIQVDEVLANNSVYRIEINYIAPVSTNITNGLYLSSYLDPVTQEIRRQAATQMEPLAARQMFPCFDEPGLKATFNVSITRKANNFALFNTLPRLSEDLGNGYIRDSFEQTPPMPTYLVALFIADSSDFSRVQVMDSELQIPIRVYGRTDILNRDGFNYSVTKTGEVFSAFNSYFNTSFPISKLDSVAVPTKGGAMENYGLILYRQDLLVYLEGETTEKIRYDSTDVIGHEVAHQNFGNLVTCKWWSDLWLNEGFAQYMSHLGVEMINPEFRPREKILNEMVQFAMGVDAGLLSFPLKNDALSPSEVSVVFGAITYNKGGSIVRMTENFLTEPTFQKGLQYYLKEMGGQVVEQDDLFRNLQKAADEDERLPNGLSIKDILDSWTLKKGFPLVRVNVVSQNLVAISQEPYRADFETGNDLWFVPVTVVTKEKPELVNKIPEIWLDNEGNNFVRPHNISNWLMINQDGTGFYRVMYDDRLLALIKIQLDEDNSLISPLSRSQLLDDYFTFAWDGRSTIEDALDLTVYLNSEDHFTVWEVIFAHFEKILRMFNSNPNYYETLKQFLLPIIESALLKQGDRNGIERIFKSHLYDWACALESSVCTSYAKELLQSWVANPTVDPVPIDFTASLYCAIAGVGGSDALELFDDLYSNAPVGSVKQLKYLAATGCLNEAELLQNVLDRALNPKPVPFEPDRLTGLLVVTKSPLGRSLVWTVLTERLDEVISIVGNGTVTPVANVISNLAVYYNSQAELNDVDGFVNLHSNLLEPVRGELDNALGTIRGNMAWMEVFGTAILNWLNQNRLTKGI